MKKVVAVILICAVVAVGGYFAFFYKSDAEKIVERLETFEEAYSTGNFEGVIDCMDAKSRNALKGVGKLGSMVGGDVGPLDINFGSDLFSGLFALGVATRMSKLSLRLNALTLRMILTLWLLPMFGRARTIFMTRLIPRRHLK